MAWDDNVIVLMIVIMTVNAVLLVANTQLSQTLLTNPGNFNNLPKQLNTLGVSGVAANIDVNSDQVSSFTTESNTFRFPGFDLVGKFLGSLYNLVTGLLFSYIGTLQIIGIPDYIIFIIAT